MRGWRPLNSVLVLRILTGELLRRSPGFVAYGQRRRLVLRGYTLLGKYLRADTNNLWFAPLKK